MQIYLEISVYNIQNIRINYQKPPFKRQTPAKSKAKISRFIAVLPRIGFIADPTDCLRLFQVLIWRVR